MADRPDGETPGPEVRLGIGNRRRRVFHELLATLPAKIRVTVKVRFKQFVANPRNVSLRLHRLKDHARGQHLPGSYSVSVTMKYRAIFFIDGQVNVWYWIGSHADYDLFTGVK